MHRYISDLLILPIMLLGSMHICHAANGGSATASSDTTRHPSHRFTIAASGGLIVPVSSRKREWAPFPTWGLTLELPTYHRLLQIAFSGEVGEIEGVNVSGRDRYLGVLTTIFLFEIPCTGRMLAVRPFCGVSNTIVAISQQTSGILHGDLFSTTESEFGVCTGMDISVRLRRVAISIPVRANAAFSAPQAFVSLSFPLALSIIVR